MPTREFSLDNPRSSHCPAIRPGPALGCNFCWNTIDAHGRILRRKTKYHCPECQTNLCIVPCFQEYHERQNNEQAATAAAGSGGGVNSGSSSTISNTQQPPMTGSSRGTSPTGGRGGSGATDKSVDGGAQTGRGNRPRLAAFGALSSGSTNSSSPSVDSAGSQTAATGQQSPDFSRAPALQ